MDSSSNNDDNPVDLDDVVSSLLRDLDNTEGKEQRLAALAERIALLRDLDSSDDDDEQEKDSNRDDDSNGDNDDSYRENEQIVEESEEDTDGNKSPQQRNEVFRQPSFRVDELYHNPHGPLLPSSSSCTTTTTSVGTVGSNDGKDNGTDYGSSRVWLPIEDDTAQSNEEPSDLASTINPHTTTKSSRSSFPSSSENTRTTTVTTTTYPHPMTPLTSSSLKGKSLRTTDSTDTSSSASSPSPLSSPSTNTSSRKKPTKSSMNKKNTGQVSENVKGLLASLFQTAQNEVKKDEKERMKNEEEEETRIPNSSSSSSSSPRASTTTTTTTTYRPHRIQNIDSLSNFLVSSIASDKEESSSEEEKHQKTTHHKPTVSSASLASITSSSSVHVSEDVRNVLGSLLGDAVRTTPSSAISHTTTVVPESEQRQSEPHTVPLNHHHRDHHTAKDPSSTTTTPSGSMVSKKSSASSSKKPHGTVTNEIRNILGDLLHHTHQTTEHHQNDTVAESSSSSFTFSPPPHPTIPSSTTKAAHRSRKSPRSTPSSSTSYSSRSSRRSTPISDLSQTIAALDHSLKDMQQERDAFEVFRQQVLAAIARLTPVPLPVATSTTVPSSTAKVPPPSTEASILRSPLAPTKPLTETIVPPTPPIIVDSTSAIDETIRTPSLSTTTKSVHDRSFVSRDSPLAQVQENLEHVMKTLDSIRKNTYSHGSASKVISPPNPTSSLFRSGVSATDSLHSPLPSRMLYTETTPFSPTATKLSSPSTVSSPHGLPFNPSYEGNSNPNPYTRELMQALALAETAAHRATTAEATVTELAQRLREMETVHRPYPDPTDTYRDNRSNKDNVHWKEEYSYPSTHIPHEQVRGSSSSPVSSRDRSPVQYRSTTHIRSDTPLSSRVGRNVDAPPLPKLYGNSNGPISVKPAIVQTMNRGVQSTHPRKHEKKSIDTSSSSSEEDEETKEKQRSGKERIPSRAESLHAALKSAERAAALQEEASQAKLRSMMLEGQVKEQRWVASIQAAQMQGIIKSVSSAMVDLGKAAHIDDGTESHRTSRPPRSSNSHRSVPNSSASEGTGRPPYWPNERVYVPSSRPVPASSRYPPPPGTMDETEPQLQRMRNEHNKELIRMLQATLAKTISVIDPKNPNLALLSRLPDLE